MCFSPLNRLLSPPKYSHLQKINQLVQSIKPDDFSPVGSCTVTAEGKQPLWLCSCLWPVWALLRNLGEGRLQWTFISVFMLALLLGSQICRCLRKSPGHGGQSPSWPNYLVHLYNCRTGTMGLKLCTGPSPSSLDVRRSSFLWSEVLCLMWMNLRHRGWKEAHPRGLWDH